MSKIDFSKSKAAPIDMSDLNQSIKELLPDGSPVGGITHENLLGMVIDKFSQKNPVKINTLVAVNNADRYRPGVSIDQEKQASYGEGDPRCMMFRRIHANIQIGEDADVITNIGIAWHQLGFTIGIGPMVTVCQNGCILGAEKILSSYTLPSHSLKERKVSIEELENSLNSWNANLPQIMDEGSQFVEKAQGSFLNINSCYHIFGGLNVWRIKNERIKAKEVAKNICPVNQTQLNKSIEKYLDRIAGHEDNPDFAITAWDFVNLLNFTLNPYSCDVPNIIPQQYAVTELVSDMIK